MIWAEATLQFDQWKDVMQTEQPAKLKVFEDYFFVSSIWDRNNIRYSGIHRLNEKGEIIPGSGLNMDNYEWMNVMKKRHDIDDALYGKQNTQGQKRGAVNEVEVWTFNWHLNGNPIPVDESEKKKRKFYTEEDAESVGKLNKPTMKTKKSDKLEMEIVSEYVRQPDPIMMMEMVVYVFVNEGIQMMTVQNCYACQSNGPSPDCKVKHMAVGGCLEPDTNFGEKYVRAVLGMLEMGPIMFIYNMACRQLKITPHGSDLLSKAAITWISESDLQMVTNQDEEGVNVQKGGQSGTYLQRVLLPENTSLYHLIRDLFYKFHYDDVMTENVRDYVAMGYMDKKPCTSTTV